MEFREAVIRALGDFPQKPKLDFKVISSEEIDGYTKQTVEYNVEESERVRAFLLLPKTLREKNPAVLAAHQHNVQYHLGKSEVVGTAGDPMYAYGLELCLRGYVVIAPDHLCFEERIAPYYQEMADNNRTYELVEYLRRESYGSSLQAKYLHDLTIAVDVLESLPVVDRNRIGVIGHSLGGQEATWLMWYDKRITAGISSCGISQVASILRNSFPLAYSLYIPGFLKYGDTSDVVCDIAPRHYFMTNGSKDDLFPIDGVETIIEKAKERYAKLGYAENFRSIIFDGGHMFSNDVKREVYAWLDDVLGNTEY